MQKRASTVWVLGVLCVAQTASAQEGSTFGAAGSPVFSAERLTGVYVDSTDVEWDGEASLVAGAPQAMEGDSETSTTTFAVLGNNQEVGPAGIPRLAFDFFVLDSLSVGGSLMYTSQSEEADESSRFPGQPTAMQPDDTQQDTTTKTFAFSPRVGYGLMFTDVLGLWGRGGITYVWGSDETETDEIDTATGTVTRSKEKLSLDHWSLSLEGMLILSPVDHFAFAVGPYIDIPMIGSAELEGDYAGATALDAEGDVSVLSFGLSAGILGWL